MLLKPIQEPLLVLLVKVGKHHIAAKNQVEYPPGQRPPYVTLLEIDILPQFFADLIRFAKAIGIFPGTIPYIIFVLTVLPDGHPIFPGVE